MRNIPENNLAYPILLFSDNKSSGSGFRLNRNNKVFIVTAKHVLFENGKQKGTSLEIHCPSGHIDDDSVHIFSIDLNKTPPIPHKDADVCAIFIAITEETEGDEKKFGDYKTSYIDGVETITKGNSTGIVVNASSATKLLKDVLISNDIFLYGYPTSLGLNHGLDFDFTKPLLRKGIVSNVNAKNGTIILDCRTDYGNSGGPVIEVSRKEEDEFHNVIGVVSKFLTLKNEWINTRDNTTHSENINAGYTIVVSMDKVFEITDNH